MTHKKKPVRFINRVLLILKLAILGTFFIFIYTGILVKIAGLNTYAGYENALVFAFISSLLIPINIVGWFLLFRFLQGYGAGFISGGFGGFFRGGSLAKNSPWYIRLNLLIASLFFIILSTGFLIQLGYPLISDEEINPLSPLGYIVKYSSVLSDTVFSRKIRN